MRLEGWDTVMMFPPFETDAARPPQGEAFFERE